MIKRGISFFRGKRVLLLQGPMGPFFQRLALDLEWAGAKVCKVNFNGGDRLFYRDGICYRGAMEDWPTFCEQLIIERGIDIILLFGDCRPIHQEARKIALQHRVEIGVFEEGYIRPDYITFERFGVNGNSPLSNITELHPISKKIGNITPVPVGNTFWHAALWAVLYYLASASSLPAFPHYRHHRPLTLLEGLFWLRGAGRKWYYRLKEAGIESRLSTSPLNGNYFLVPLQVHNDAQISIHSRFESVEEFIHDVVRSFAVHAPRQTALVIKHHPLDRGYHDYSRLIGKYCHQYRLKGRLYYIHDQHLPTLLKHSRGVVVINSTVGLSAIHHNTPVKTCGKALYDLRGLTFQGTLDQFWSKAHAFHLNRNIFKRFRYHLIAQSQLNGSFYKRLPVPGSHTGLRWTLVSQGFPLPTPEQTTRPEQTVATENSSLS